MRCDAMRCLIDEPVAGGLAQYPCLPSHLDTTKLEIAPSDFLLNEYKSFDEVNTFPPLG